MYGLSQAGGDSDWVAGLSRFLDEAGISGGLVEETVLKLRAAGTTEQQLRTTATAEELRDMGILLGPRWLGSEVLDEIQVE
jgi:hypothetical protein